MFSTDRQHALAALWTTLISMFLAAGAAPAATINVPADQATVQAAVNAAAAGDVIRLANGTYNENVDLGTGPANFRLEAANAGLATINGGAGGAALSVSGTSQNIVINGVNLDADSGQAATVSVTNLAGGVRFLNCTLVLGFGGDGIAVTMTGAISTAVEVRGCTFNNPADNAEGIRLAVDGTGTLDFVADTNTFNGMEDDGIELDMADTGAPSGTRILLRILNNIFNAADGTGSSIDLFLGDNTISGLQASVLIDNNNFTGAIGEAIRISTDGNDSDTSIVITNNVITSLPLETGVLVRQESSTVGNEINLLIDNNSITEGDIGIELAARSAAGMAASVFFARVSNNTLDGGAANGRFEPLVVDAEDVPDAYTLNLDVFSNTLSNLDGGQFFLLQGNGSTFNLGQGVSSLFDPGRVLGENNTGVANPSNISGSVTVVAGSSVPASRLPATLGDEVFSDNNGNGVNDGGDTGFPNVAVALAGTATAGASVNLVTRSDSTGAYAIPALLPGTYTLTATAPAGFDFVTQDVGAIDTVDSDVSAVGTASVTFTVNDDTVDVGLEPATPEFTIDDVTLAEGNAGITTFTFAVTLDLATGGVATVAFATADNTATTANGDYVANSGTLNFAGNAGETATVSIPVIGDTDVEFDETFFVNLTNPTGGAAIGDSQGLGTITSDDIPPPAEFTIADVTATEGNGGTTTFTFTVTLDAATGGAVAVEFATADGTATTADGDYVATASTLNFAGNAGETQTIDITVNGDTTVEADETFTVGLSNPTGGTILGTPSTATGTIENDDTAAPPIPVELETFDVD